VWKDKDAKMSTQPGDPIICQTSSKSVRVNSDDKQISKRYISVQPNPVFFQFFIEEPILINNVLLL
jgi:hypothetical protein